VFFPRTFVSPPDTQEKFIFLIRGSLIGYDNGNASFVFRLIALPDV